VAKDRIRPAKLAEAIAAHLEGLILEGSLRAGDRLLAERELAQKLDVSRPSLREALDLLARRGLLETSRGGNHVAPPLGSQFSRSLASLLAERPESTYDYLEFRGFLEGAAAYFAALRASVADREMIRRQFGAIESAHSLDPSSEEADADAGFHLAIYEASHNLMMLHVMGSLSDMLRQDIFYNRERLYTRKGVRPLLLDQHRAVHDAVIQGDPEAARAAAEAHVKFTRSALREIDKADSHLERSLRSLASAAEVPAPPTQPVAEAATLPAGAADPRAMPLAALLKSHPDTVFDYLEFRLIVAGMAARMAAERATDADRAILHQAFANLQAAHLSQDLAEQADADADFHLATYRATHNLVMEYVMRSIFAMLRHNIFYDRNRLYRRDGVRDLLLRQHKAILDGIVSGDAAAAAQAAERHILYTRETLQESRVAEKRLEVALRRQGRDSLAQLTEREALP